MKTPFFSIIIPTYNRKEFVKIAITSVLSQSYPDYELIVIDDGSCDGTKEAFNGYPGIKYVWQEHRGVAEARNAGVRISGGEFICFLDSDDRFRQDKLEITDKHIKANPKYKIFHTEEIWYRSGQYLAQKEYHRKLAGWVFENAVKICSISISTVTIHKEIFKEVGLFDKNFSACEDYDFWLRVTAKFPVYLIPEYLTIKEGGHSDQQSKKYPAMDLFRISALQKIIADSSLSIENRNIAFQELKRKCEIYIKGAEKRGKFEEVDKYKKMLLELENKYV